MNKIICIIGLTLGGLLTGSMVHLSFWASIWIGPGIFVLLMACQAEWKEL